MGQDVATDRLFGIDSVSHATTRVSSDLIGQENGNVELLTDFLELRQDTGQDLLALSKFTAAGVVHTERSHDRVNNHQREAVFHHD